MKKIILGLDVDKTGLQEIQRSELIERLAPYVDICKVGSQLATSIGPPAAVDFVHSRGAKVFLDLKFKDTPKTVAATVLAAANLGVYMLTINADSGSKVMLAAAEVLKEHPNPPLLFGVTVLTSMDRSDMSEVGIRGDYTVEKQVVQLATLSHKCGLNGVVASAQEAIAIRTKIPDRNFKIVTPAIRMEWADWTILDDQARPTTHIEAIQAGADFIVIARALLDAPDQVAATKRTSEEIDAL